MEKTIACHPPPNSWSLQGKVKAALKTEKRNKNKNLQLQLAHFAEHLDFKESEERGSWHGHIRIDLKLFNFVSRVVFPCDA